ncbi:MAG TPA: hypothetical protein PKM63_01015 [Panacibacter sp.]|nr:hypothetical protein [Panacibacter sp.]HNP42833.1 hypothetical protein [Panacibacter sp.]
MKNEKHESWEAVKAEIKKEHPHLTDDDLACEIGKEAAMLRDLQKKLKMNEHQIRKWLSLMG